MKTMRFVVWVFVVSFACWGVIVLCKKNPEAPKTYNITRYCLIERVDPNDGYLNWVGLCRVDGRPVTKDDFLIGE